MTQCDRIDAVLDKRPVTIADFDRQPACDGGDRITRLAARIQDLKDRGRDIRSRWVTLGNTQVKQYYKVSQSCPDVSSLPTGQPAAPAATPIPLLAQPTSSQCALDDDWDWAA
ncbi:MAG: hypothetical protein KGL39_38570 [Patescibacteria group bacterium]|nr:hypothetical protein [Patescibacteria group bacterium]